MKIQSLAQYRVIRQLGTGGMGVVYLGRDERLDRDVAIKVLPPGSFAGDESRTRFRREALTLSRLNHPNIATIYDFNTVDSIDFLVMEFIDGTTLSSHIELGISEAEVVRIGIQISEALEDAHEKLVVHCDLKPQNIMTSAKGRVKILDFGLAQLIRPLESESTVSAVTASVGGSLPYMSPEQLSGEKPGPATDIYALGAVLYEMVTGQCPFPEKQPVRLADDILHAQPRSPRALNPRVAEDLEVVILRCLKKEPSQRFGSAGALTTELRRLSETGITRGASQQRKKKLWMSGIVFAVLLAACVLWYWLLVSPTRSLEHARIESLAVLPLENVSGNKDQDYFVEGMTDELTSDLAQVGALQVVSRTSARAYKDSTKSVRDLAHEMNVDAIVEGSVSRVGNRVRINAQLIDAHADRHLWAGSYERDLNDTLTLQTEVAAAIAKAVNARLTPREEKKFHDDRRVNPEAYDYFLLGRQHAARQNPDDNQIAIDLLEHSIALDPTFAEAHAELGSTYNTKLFFYSAGDEALKNKVFAEVQTALRLDPELAEAHLARGVILWSPSANFAHAEAIKEFRHAIRLKPSLDEAHHQLGLVYMHIGFPDEALKEIGIALKLNPENMLARMRTGVAMLYGQRFAEAEDIFSRISPDSNPALVVSQQIWLLSALGRTREANQILQRYVEAHPDDPGGMVYGAAARLASLQNHKNDMTRYIGLALKNRKNFGHFHHTAYSIASAYAQQGESKLAVQWLQAAADDGLPCYSLFKDDPDLNKIRNSREFVSFLAAQKTVHDDFQRFFDSNSSRNEP